MTGRRLILVLLLVVATLPASIASGTARAATPTYTITDLGTLGGTQTIAYGLNDAGQVVGASNIPGDTVAHAFLWQNGTMTDLGAPPNYMSSAARDINSTGQIVGTSVNGAGYSLATMWQGGIATALESGSLGGANADVISADGLVAGNIQTCGCPSYGVEWRGSKVVADIPSLGFGGARSIAINDANQIVGESQIFTGTDILTHAFLWQNGVTTDLGPDTSRSSGDSSATDINNRGQIVGVAYYPAFSAHHATLWQNGTATDLDSGPYDSHAHGINDSGVIVGDHLGDAALWQGGVVVGLSSLIPQMNGWSLQYAQAINNAGQIIGQGTINGQHRAFLLTPTSNAQVLLNPATLTFDSQPLGTTSSAQTVTFANTGMDTLRMGAVTLTGAQAGEFHIAADLCSGATVASIKACSVRVTFSPAAAGDRSASLVFADANGGTPRTVPLIGKGVVATGSGGCPGTTPSPSPSSVVILLMGVNSSLPDNNSSASPTQAIFNPLAMSYCGLDNTPANDPAHQFLKKVAGYFSPRDGNGKLLGQSPTLPDMLAGTGAVLLPFSYEGATLDRDQAGRPRFTVNSYTTDKPGNSLPTAPARLLAREVASIHQVWPDTPIVIVGHSEGGLVAETYFQAFLGNEALSPRKNNVIRIFSLDSPINGVAAPSRFCRDTSCGPIPVGKLLAMYYETLWRRRQLNGPIIAAADGPDRGAGIYEAIGSDGDWLYNGADFGNGLDSQLIYDGNALVYPPSVPPFIVPSFGVHPIQNFFWTHLYVMGNGQVISRIYQAVTGLSPYSMPTPTRSADTESVASTAQVSPTTAQLQASTASATQAVNIAGSGLGTDLGVIELFAANGTPVLAPVTGWSDTRVTFTLPPTAVTGPVVVLTSAGRELLAGDLTVLAPANGVASLRVQVGPAAIQGQAASVTVTALDAAQQPVPNVAVGLSDGRSVQSGQADAAGVATFAVIGYGTQDFVAFSGTASTPIAISWQDPPAQSLALVASATSVSPEQPVTISATVTDANGQPVANQPVTFRVNGPGTVALGTTQATTNAQGVATTTTTNSALGEAVVTASTNYDALAQIVTVDWVLPTYALTLQATVGGTASAAPGPGPYDAGSTVTIAATANVGYTFGSWAVDGVVAGQANPLSVTMDRDHTVVATFAPISAPSPSPSPSPSPVPISSPPPSPIAGVGLTVIAASGGSVGGVTPGSYPVGQQVSLIAMPAAGNTFLGWQISGRQGTAIGTAPPVATWANPLALTLTTDTTVTPVFAPKPMFGDVPEFFNSAHNIVALAVTQLAARGIINGCDSAATPPLFCPQDTTLREQMAALIVRAMPGWAGEAWPNTFTDPTSDAELWARVGTLQHYGVVGGYTAESCTAQGKTPPCYGPLDPVLRAQAISFVTRAMIKHGYWTARPIDPNLYGGVLNGTGHEQDAATYWFYTRSLGGVPNYPENTPFPFEGSAPRDWFAMLLWTALDSYFGH